MEKAVREYGYKRVDAANFVKTMEQHQYCKIAYKKEIAYLNSWISKDDLMEVYEVMKKNKYDQYQY